MQQPLERHCCCLDCQTRARLVYWCVFVVHCISLGLAIAVCMVFRSILAGLGVVATWSLVIEGLHRWGQGLECSIQLDSDLDTGAFRSNDQNCCTTCCKVPTSSRCVSVCTPAWRLHNLIYLAIVFGSLLVAFLGWICFCYWGKEPHICANGEGANAQHFTTWQSLASPAFALGAPGFIFTYGFLFGIILLGIAMVVSGIYLVVCHYRRIAYTHL